MFSDVVEIVIYYVCICVCVCVCVCVCAYMCAFMRACVVHNPHRGMANIDLQRSMAAGRLASDHHRLSVNVSYQWPRSPETVASH